VFAALAPTFQAQQKRIDEQEEANKLMASKLSILETAFSNLQVLVKENIIPDLDEPRNPAEPSQIPLALGPPVTRQSRRSRRANHTTLSDSTGQTNDPVPAPNRDESSFLEIDFPTPPSGLPSALQYHPNTASTNPYTHTGSPQSPSPQNYSFFDSADDTQPSFAEQYANSQSTPSAQRLLSLHESLRDEVTRVAGALHELDARHNITMFSENLRLKEDIAFLDAQVSGLFGQVGWLMNTRLQAQQAQTQTHNPPQNQGQAPQSQMNASRPQSSSHRHGDESRGEEAETGANSGQTLMAMRGSARMVQLGGTRRSGVDEGRTKL